jgi:hypothetical protein
MSSLVNEKAFEEAIEQSLIDLSALPRRQAGDRQV